MRKTGLRGLASGTALAVILAGCAIKPAEEITVYKTKGAVQCESSGMSIFESESLLRNSGVDVIFSQCGVLEGMSFAQMCGGKTGDILVHTINARYGDLAASMGYEPVATLITKDTPKGFNVADCQ
ncbi:hypothetical protein G5S52_04835 [Grimontia sp. S25]|uniref:Lipoprotein n=1 Tax=Grimontia sedimenti TaxID=2711294 RepID=A0A6M1RA10_9GAMM|nr:hypothetical protein [Grimontia sedimenti]NGN97000.1 hypothetical protein [Grimontia sedimenti]